MKSLTARLVLAHALIALLVCIVSFFGIWRETTLRLDEQVRVYATSLGASASWVAEADADAAQAFAAEISMYHAQVMRGAFRLSEPPELLYQGFDAAGAMRFRSAGAPARPLMSGGNVSVANSNAHTTPSTVGTAAKVAVNVDARGRVRLLAGTQSAPGSPVTHALQHPDENGESLVARAGVIHSLPLGERAQTHGFHAPFVLRSGASPLMTAMPVPLASTWNDATAEARDIELDGRAWRAVRVRDRTGRQIQAAESASWRRQATIASVEPAIKLLAIASPLVLLLSLAIARYTMAPLRRLTAAISARTPSDLARIAPGGPGEVAPLVGEINRLLAQVQQLLSAEREAFADAAHELLTPVAAVQAQAYVLGVAERTEERESARADLDRCVERLTAMIRQLLMLARADSIAPLATRTEADLAEALQARVAAAIAQARSKNILVALESPPACRWRFDPDTLLAAIDNLLDNAIRYSPPGSRVLVSLVRDAHAIAIEVEDDGPGIPPEHRARVFQRFFRVPGTSAPGSGLGLAIVQRVAQLHGGAVTLDAGAGGRGVKATMRFSIP